MKKNKLKTILIIVTTIFVIAITTKTVMAYFSTYVWATTNKIISVGFITSSINKQVNGNQTTINVKNTSNLRCHIRLKILTPTDVTYTVVNNNDIWKQENDGYWYYFESLKEQATTQNFTIQLNNSSKNVMVIAEMADVIENNKNDWVKVYSQSK